MRLLVLGLLWPAMLFAQTPESEIEEILSASDSESIITDSLEQSVSFILEPRSPAQSSEDDPLHGATGARFQTSFQWVQCSGSSATWKSTWGRTRLTTYSGRKLQTDLLLVRRAGDPRTIDELHLTVVGRHKHSKVRYAFGTYQLDWGLGALSSSSFGAARRLSYYRTTYVARGKGVIPLTTAREESWFRGAAIERDFGHIRFVLFSNLRDWNALNEDSVRHLSGVLSTESEQRLMERDQVEEFSYGGSAECVGKNFTLGLLTQRSNFMPELDQARSLGSFSGCLTFDQRGVQGISEFARSGSETAWISTLSHGTENWSGAFYVMSASDKYFAPRSQSPFSFGGEFTDSRTVGMRIGASYNRHEIALDLRSGRSKGTESLLFKDEVLAGWYFDAADNVVVSTRLRFAVDEESTSERALSSLRFETSWIRVLTFTTRAEFRRFTRSNDNLVGTGSYLHIQAIRPNGLIRPGIRAASFSLADIGSQLQVYEPAVSGAYPFETFSGNGNRVSGWITINLRSIEVHSKAAWTNRTNSGSSADFAFAMTIHK